MIRPSSESKRAKGSVGHDYFKVFNRDKKINQSIVTVFVFVPLLLPLLTQVASIIKNQPDELMLHLHLGGVSYRGGPINYHTASGDPCRYQHIASPSEHGAP